MIDIKPLKLIHASFCTGILLFGLAVFFTNKESFIFDFTLFHPDTTVHTLSFVTVIFTVLAMNLGTYFFKKMINNIEDLATPQQKFAKYQLAFLIKCALLEGAAFFCLAMCLITYNFYFIVVAGFSFIALLIMSPTKEKVFTLLQIQDNEPFNGI